MTDHAALIAALITANRDGGTVPAGGFVGLTRAEAAAIQLEVAGQLGGAVQAVKISVFGDGTAMVAQVPNGRVVASGGSLSVPKRGLTGLEVEVAVRLKTEIVSGSGVDVRACIGAVVVCLEIIDARLDDRTAAGPWGPFADAMVTGGLVFGPDLNADGMMTPDGLAISVLADGVSVFDGAAKHPFGSAITPLQAFADKRAEGIGSLPAGTLVTTGSLTPLIAIGGPSRFAVTLGTEAVSVTFS